MSDSLVDFLRARLDEDEQAARAAHIETTLPAVWSALFEASGHSHASTQPALEHVARHDPARVLAEVAAERAIVDLHDDEHLCIEDMGGSYIPCLSGSRSVNGVTLEGCQTLRLLAAAACSDHPDYDPAWAPQ